MTESEVLEKARRDKQKSANQEAIKSLARKKKELEGRIASLVSREVYNFMLETGCEVNRVSLDYVDASCLGEEVRNLLWTSDVDLLLGRVEYYGA